LKIEKEIAFYNSFKDLKNKIIFYLKNENLRQDIAENGYNRAVNTHTAQNYMQQLVNKVIGV